MYVVEPIKKINFGATGVEEILQNVAFLMGTTMMSCPLDRAFGWDNGIDSPIHITKAKYINQLTEAILNFEPRVIVESIEFEGDYSKGKLVPKVKVILNDESL